jgi:hypothetical protein
MSKYAAESSRFNLAFSAPFDCPVTPFANQFLTVSAQIPASLAAWAAVIPSFLTLANICSLPLLV